MIQSGLNRRQFLTTGLAGALSAMSALNACGAALEAKIFPRPFAASRTVSSFASGLFFCEDAMPLILRRAIEAELDRTVVVPDSPADEHLQAEFFALLAVKCIAPFALRRAGYDRLATGVANGMLTPAFAPYHRQAICLLSSNTSAGNIRLWRECPRRDGRLLCRSLSPRRGITVRGHCSNSPTKAWMPRNPLGFGTLP